MTRLLKCENFNFKKTYNFVSQFHSSISLSALQGSMYLSNKSHNIYLYSQMNSFNSLQWSRVKMWLESWIFLGSICKHSSSKHLASSSISEWQQISTNTIIPTLHCCFGWSESDLIFTYPATAWAIGYRYRPGSRPSLHFHKHIITRWKLSNIFSSSK